MLEQYESFEHTTSCPGYIEPIQRIKPPDKSGIDHSNVISNRSVLCVFRHKTAAHIEPFLLCISVCTSYDSTRRRRRATMSRNAVRTNSIRVVAVRNLPCLCRSSIQFGFTNTTPCSSDYILIGLTYIRKSFSALC
jgi:hypothetical protein